MAKVVRGEGNPEQLQLLSRGLSTVFEKLRRHHDQFRIELSTNPHTASSMVTNGSVIGYSILEGYSRMAEIIARSITVVSTRA